MVFFLLCCWWNGKRHGQSCSGELGTSEDRRKVSRRQQCAQMFPGKCVCRKKEARRQQRAEQKTSCDAWGGNIFGKTNSYKSLKSKRSLLLVDAEEVGVFTDVGVDFMVTVSIIPWQELWTDFSFTASCTHKKIGVEHSYFSEEPCRRGLSLSAKLLSPAIFVVPGLFVDHKGFFFLLISVYLCVAWHSWESLSYMAPCQRFFSASYGRWFSVRISGNVLYLHLISHFWLEVVIMELLWCKLLHGRSIENQLLDILTSCLK